jgi:predicted alpha/beta hydrolase family esterase
LLPGIGNSGAEHWQTLWERRLPDSRRLQPTDWDRPVLADWLRALDEAVDAIGGPTLLVAHSLACLLVAHWALCPEAGGGPRLAQVRGAFLVAVPDPASTAFPEEAAGFAAVPTAPLPFPVLVTASSDDPYGSLAHARRFADAWGADFVEAGALGHINGASGIGDWPQGWTLLEDFRRQYGID